MPAPAPGDAKPHPGGVSGSAAAADVGYAVAAAAGVLASHRRNRQDERSRRRASRWGRDLR
jgi:hypothetical protein